MIRKVYLTTCLFVFSLTAVIAQTGSIKGRIIDKASKEPLPFANVVAILNGTQAGGAQTDFDGNFTIKPLNPGKYDLKATFVGYTTAEVTGVLVSADKITFQDVDLNKGAVDITQVDIISYKVPLVDKGNPSTQTTIVQEEIEAAPTRDVKSIVSTAAGVYQEDEGDDVNIRGSRSNATDYYIDGIKTRGSVNLPQQGIEQITVVTGGVPAQYGDATGGIINITTRGPSNEFFGGVEYVTSELFDDYGYNLVGGNVSGPIWMKKNADGTKTSRLSFFLSGEYQSEDDPNPSAIGIYKVKDDVLNQLEQNPLTPNPLVPRSYQLSAQNLLASDLENVDAKQNTPKKSIRGTAKLDFQILKNLTLTLGGTIDRSDEKRFIWEYSLMNYKNNPQRIDNTWRAFGRITQRFDNPDAKDKSASIIKNAFYSLQFDYSKFTRTDQNEGVEDNIFEYGYLGKFKSQRDQTFITAALDTSGTDIIYTTHFYNQGWNDTLVVFEPGDVGSNQATQNYTNQFYSLAGDDYFQYGSIENIINFGGLVNGLRPGAVHGTWHNVGRQNNIYAETDNTQIRVSAMGSADIKNHAITVGFEYEQRVDRYWQIGPMNSLGLWYQMRQLANTKLSAMESSFTVDANGDTVKTYTSAYSNPNNTPTFYENIRKKLGLSNFDYVDVYSYDPSEFSLDLFTPDELLNNGSNYIYYYGFDYDGKNKTSGNPSFEDFFTKKDANGNYTREIAPFQPVYMAGYIQDKFAFKDLIFNVGLRVDRFDANQKVLKDMFLLYPAHKAGDAEVVGLFGSAPSGIGSDYVVYVDDANDPTKILGYRDGDEWYDAEGNQLADPEAIAQGSSTGVITPWLLDPDTEINDPAFDATKSFQDYDPQITVMPRIAFSFPISDEAQFFAHYDILTQRPPNRIEVNPIDYLFLAQNQGALINNPDLKPEKTIDYEIGFKQTLSRSSAMTISAFYREMRDMIHFINLTYAHPVTYQTYGNKDFGTVKGLSFGYDLRRTNNVRLTANYTLQFADGTGSNDRTGADLSNTSQPNLKSIVPLDFDQRHNIVTTIDFRYGEGKDYNGLMLFGKPVFTNTGLNVIFRAGSGTPYSKQSTIVTEAATIGLQQAATRRLDGGVNNARLPWQFRVDAKLDKDFALKIGKKSTYLNVYIQAMNLLDAKNIINVYRATGSPDDDGYLASPDGQVTIAGQINPQSYVDLYNVKLANPDNYSIPRRVRVGVKLDF